MLLEGPTYPGLGTVGILVMGDGNQVVVIQSRRDRKTKKRCSHGSSKSGIRKRERQDRRTVPKSGLIFEKEEYTQSRVYDRTTSEKRLVS